MLRGDLPLALDARLIERGARTPCQRLRANVVAGTDPERVLVAAHGEDALQVETGRISPFARAIGVAFERRVMADKAKLIRELYRRSLAIAEVVDLRHFLDNREPEKAEEHTIALIEHRVATGEGPDLVLGARLPLETSAGTVHIRPDYLVFRGKAARVGEVKSYLDLDGRTDASEIGTAVRQAAIGVLTIRALFGEGACEHIVDLVLRSPRRPWATLRPLDGTAEIANISAFLSSMKKEEQEVEAATNGVPLLVPGAIEAVPHRFEASCETHCAFFAVCHDEAIAKDELTLLGASAAAALEGVGTVARATELAQGAPPLTPDEERVAAVLEVAWRASEAIEVQPGTG